MANQSPAERLFTLTCCLLAAPVVGLSKQDIFASVLGYQGVESTDALEKLFDRDKKALRSLGVQLEVVSFDAFEDAENQRYRLAKGDFTWPNELELTPAQLGILELAGRAWNNQQFAQSARSGIGRLKSRGMVEVDRQLSFIAPRILARHAAIEPLTNAIENQEMVIFEYRKPDGSRRLRELAPLKLRLIQGEWVLLAKEATEIKNFLVRRIISKVKNTGAGFASVAKEEVDAAEADLIDFTNSQVARLTTAADSEAFWHFGGENTEVELNYMDEALLAEDLLEFGSEVTVISPASLANRIEQALEQVVISHA